MFLAIYCQKPTPFQRTATQTATRMTRSVSDCYHTRVAVLQFFLSKNTKYVSFRQRIIRIGRIFSLRINSDFTDFRRHAARVPRGTAKWWGRVVFYLSRIRELENFFSAKRSAGFERGVSGYWLLAIGCWILAVSCWLLDLSSQPSTLSPLFRQRISRIIRIISLQINSDFTDFKRHAARVPSGGHEPRAKG